MFSWLRVFWKLLNYDHVPWENVFLGCPLLISHYCSAKVEARVTNNGGRQSNDLDSWSVFGICDMAYGIWPWASLLLTCPSALSTAHVVSCTQQKYDCAIIYLHSNHNVSQKPFTLGDVWVRSRSFVRSITEFSQGGNEHTTLMLRGEGGRWLLAEH